MKIGGSVGGDAAQGNIDKSQTGVTSTSGVQPPKGLIPVVGAIIAATIAGLMWLHAQGLLPISSQDDAVEQVEEAPTDGG